MSWSQISRILIIIILNKKLHFWISKAKQFLRRRLTHLHKLYTVAKESIILRRFTIRKLEDITLSISAITAIKTTTKIVMSKIIWESIQTIGTIDQAQKDKKTYQKIYSNSEKQNGSTWRRQGRWKLRKVVCEVKFFKIGFLKI
jgi:hypothetical protein